MLVGLDRLAALAGPFDRPAQLLRCQQHQPVLGINSGHIDVFDKNFMPTTVSGGFVDPNIPAGFAPFNVQNINGKLYVTYARQDADKHDDVAGMGNGFVDVFDTNGNLLERLVTNGPLNSPWGLALAPGDFGQFSNDLLVGNFGDGMINASIR
jgi:uncharacterized protein (TIGR03118 family)